MKKHTAKSILPAVAVLCAVCVVAMIVALVLTGTPRFTPPPFDEQAQSGTPTVDEALGWSELDAQAFRLAVCGRFAPQDGMADVYLTNPADNRVWLKLRVLDAEGNVLGETGLIKPGEYVRAVALDRSPSVGAAVTLKIMAYEPDTYHSAGAVALNTVVSAG